MPTVDELLGRIQEGTATADDLDNLRKAYEASPLRKERDDAAAEAKRLADANAALRQTVMKTNFAAAGVTIDPSVLNLPSDLDVTDVEKVKGWAQGAGLVQAKPDTSQEELQAHDRLAGASSASGGGGNGMGMKERILAETDPSKGLSEEEFWARAGSFGVTSRRLPGAKDLSSA